MTLKIKQTVSVEVEVNFTFPMYRLKLVNEDHIEVFKFESKHKVTKISKMFGQFTILTYDDPKFDFIEDMMSENMLFGRYQFDIIQEKNFNSVLEEMINVIHKS